MKYKAATYGDKLLVLQNDHLSIHDVEDCTKQLKDWKPTKCTDVKKANDEWKAKFETQWEKCGKVEIDLSIIELI